MKKTFGIIALLLCGIMVLGLIPATAEAANFPLLDFGLRVEKTVEQSGDAVPGECSFVFVLEDDTAHKSLADYGIAMTGSTVATDGTGVFWGTLTGTVETGLVSEDNGWVKVSTDEEVYECRLVLTEQNDGYDDWTYSDEKYTVVITCDIIGERAEANVYPYSDGVAALADDAATPAAFTNIYHGRATGDSSMALWCMLMLAAAAVAAGIIVYSKKKSSIL
ncbi:MAG: hypothetical protein PUC05_01710 [Firmicutes bacterium]|nr:hypothetical protein [Bacillota bacterium]